MFWQVSGRSPAGLSQNASDRDLEPSGRSGDNRCTPYRRTGDLRAGLLFCPLDLIDSFPSMPRVGGGIDLLNHQSSADKAERNQRLTLGEEGRRSIRFLRLAMPERFSDHRRTDEIGSHAPR